MHPTTHEVILLILYAVLEWWLGRTKKVPENSSLDLLFAVVCIFGAMAMRLLPLKKIREGEK